MPIPILTGLVWCKFLYLRCGKTEMEIEKNKLIDAELRGESGLRPFQRLLTIDCHYVLYHFAFSSLGDISYLPSSTQHC